MNVADVAHAYDAAWNARDLDAIVGFHREDGWYRLNVAGLPAVRGRTAIRAAFEASLANWASLDFALVDLRCGDGFYVWESSVHGRPAAELQLGVVSIAPSEVTFSGVDVITLDGDGRIATKSTYFDLVAAANQAAA